MRKLIISTFTFITLFSLSFTYCYAQWQPDVRLTNDPAQSYTSENNAWCIAANGNMVHVVWMDEKEGRYKIFYDRSTDGGINWGANIRLTNDTGVSTEPSIAVSGQAVHIVWFDTRDGNQEIYYKHSSDEGISWSPDMRITYNISYSDNPSIAASNQVIHVVWSDRRDGNYEIYYRRSTNGGFNWESEKRLTNSAEDSYNPSIAVSGQYVHVAWYDELYGNDRYIRYVRSTDGGVNWEPDQNLTINPKNVLNPSIAVSGQTVHLVWYGDYFTLYYKRSMNGGMNWNADTSFSGGIGPSLAVSGQILHVVFNGGRNICYKRSLNGGITWDSLVTFTSDTNGAYLPSVALSGTVVHLVWSDRRQRV